MLYEVQTVQRLVQTPRNLLQHVLPVAQHSAASGFAAVAEL